MTSMQHLYKVLKMYNTDLTLYPLDSRVCHSCFLRDEMLASLPPLLESTQSHLQSKHDLEALDTQTEKLEEQKSYLEEALTDDQHLAYSLQQRSVID